MLGMSGKFEIAITCKNVSMLNVVWCLGFPGVPCMKMIPGHALHERGLRGQKGIGPLVSSWGHRAAVVLVINRLSAGRQLVIVFPCSQIYLA